MSSSSLTGFRELISMKKRRLYTSKRIGLMKRLSKYAAPGVVETVVY